ncbi:MAG: N-acetyl sugar amidotransferase [Candidatus Omnitrophica bacterium]|nr:N-acetyl sugar amidotransferase [Candidatus Omnitrophota bacterium]
MTKKRSESNHNQTGMYGLPVDVKFCKRCVISNQRPSSSIEFKNIKGSSKRTIFFDEDGVCEACRFAEKKKTIDWKQREEELKEMLSHYRSKDGSYDVVVPGSGGKDSVQAAYLLKYKYGMHPLLVTWPPHIYTDMGRRNFQAWVNTGFDNVTHMPNQKAHRLLTKLAFENLVHPFQPFILGQKNLAPKISITYNIPLVFYGENEAEYGNPIQDNTKAIRDNSYYAADRRLEEIFLGGVSAKQLMTDYGLTRSDLEPYLPANPHLLEQTKTRVHYLGYYVKWDPQSAYYFSVENTDFYPNVERTEGSYSKYNSIDDKIDWFHYYTYYIKFGIGRATNDAAQEVRNEHLRREEAVLLIRRFDGEFPQIYFKENLEYMGITEQRFYELIDKARPPHLWEQKQGQWNLKHQVS